MLHDVPGAPRLVITQNDVRQIQLAKAALYAGCRLLMDAFGIETVDRIRLAGAFGAHIDPVHALVLGLVPDCDPARVTSAGNAAGTGARIALLNRAARGEIEDVVRRVEKLETAVEPRFQEHFVGGDGHPAHDRAVPAAGGDDRSAGAADLVRRRPIVPGDAAATPRPHIPRGAPHERSGTRSAAGDDGAAAARRDRPRALHAVAERVPFITRTLQPFEVLNEEGLEPDRAQRRHDPGAGRDRVPRGARRAASCSRAPGADVDGERVRFPRGPVPRSWCRPPRRGSSRSTRATPRTHVQIGGDATVLAPAYGSPFVRDLDGGRRYGTIEDFRNFVKLAYSSPFLHHSGGTVCEPVDLPVNKRHYDMVYAHMRYSDKPFMGSVTHPQRAAGHGRRWRASCSAPTTSRTTASS